MYVGNLLYILRANILNPMCVRVRVCVCVLHLGSSDLCPKHIVLQIKCSEQ